MIDNYHISAVWTPIWFAKCPNCNGHLQAHTCSGSANVVNDGDVIRCCQCSLTGEVEKCREITWNTFEGES